MKKIQNMIPELEQNISSVDNAAWVNLLTLSTLKDRNYQSSEQLEDISAALSSGLIGKPRNNNALGGFL